MNNLEDIEIKVGDFVTLKKTATIEDLIGDHWQGCKAHTLEFIDNYKNKRARVEEITGSGNIIIDSNVTSAGYLVVNKKLVEVVEEDEPKEIQKLEYDTDIIGNSFVKNEYGANCSIKSHDKVMINKINEIIEVVNKLNERNR